jgi:hypothetical protein
MASDELLARAYEFFQVRHAKWSREFRDYVLSKEVPEPKFDIYAASFAQLWVDGKTRRQDSHAMLAIKASIRDFDRELHPTQAGRFVINQVDDKVAAPRHNVGLRPCDPARGRRREEITLSPP